MAGGREPHAEGAFARGTCSTDSASAMFLAVSKKAPPPYSIGPNRAVLGAHLQHFLQRKTIVKKRKNLQTFRTLQHELEATILN